MSFGASFAAGYSVGKDVRKRRAASKFFEEFKRLTEEDEEDVAPDGAAIPVAKEQEAGEAEPVATEALPVEKKAAIQVDSTATSPTEEPAPAAALPAAPGPAPTPTPAQSAAAQPAALPVTPEAAPAAEEQGMAAALPVEAPAEAKAAAKEADKVAAKKSLTQADIKKLDRLALKAAEAAGDIEVYTALQKTTDSFLQGKVQKYLSMAQTAAQNDDMDATEKYLTKAYRFVPDGQEVKFEKKDGKLWVNNPWQQGKDDPKQIPLGSEQISWIAVQMADPAKWGDIVRSEAAERRKTAMEERKVAVEEKRSATYERMTNAQIKDMSARLGIAEGELKLRGREQALSELNSKVSRLATYQQAAYYAALAEQAKAGGKSGATTLDQLMDNARMMAGDVDKQFSSYTTPPTDPMTGEPSRNWKPPGDVEGLSPQQIQQANGLAQAIGAANLQSTDVSPGLAVAAGLALARAGAEQGEIGVDAKNGTMTFEFNGRPTTVKLPGAVLQSLIAVEAQKRRGAAAGFPAPVQFQDPFAPPAPIFGQQP